MSYIEVDDYYGSNVVELDFAYDEDEEVVAFDRQAFIPDISIDENALSYDDERDSLRQGLSNTVKEFLGIDASSGHRVDYELKNSIFTITFVYYQKDEYSYEDLICPGIDYEKFEFSVNTKFGTSLTMKGISKLSVKKMSIELSDAIRTHSLNLEQCLMDANMPNLFHRTFCGKIFHKEADTKLSHKPLMRFP